MSKQETLIEKLDKELARNGRFNNWDLGFHYTTWLYAETLDDLFKKSFEWAKERHEQDLKDWKEEYSK